MTAGGGRGSASSAMARAPWWPQSPAPGRIVMAKAGKAGREAVHRAQRDGRGAVASVNATK